MLFTPSKKNPVVDFGSNTSITINDNPVTVLAVPLVSEDSVMGTVYKATSRLNFDMATGKLNSTSFNSLSDPNYKENLVPITEWKNLLKLISYQYQFIFSKETSDGFLSTDVQTYFPELVSKVNLEKPDSLGNNSYFSVNYNGFIPFITLGLKEHESKITLLEEEIAQLKNDLLTLRKDFQELKSQQLGN